MEIIKKLQQGGGLVFTPLAPAPINTSADKQSESKSKDGELFSDTMLKALGDNALTSDMQYFLTNARVFSDRNINPFNGNTSSFSSNVKELLMYYTRMAQQKDLYNKGLEAIKNAEAASEIAITPGGGGVYVRTSDGIAVVGVNSIDDSTKVLTNRELAHLRESNPNLAFSSELINSMGEATSFKVIRGVIDDVLQNVQADKDSVTGYANPHKLNESSLEFLRNLNLTENQLHGMSIDSVYKITKTTETARHHTQKILNSIVRNLTPNMRTLLQHRANQLQTDVPTILLEYVSSKLKDDRSVTLDIENSVNPDGTRAKKNKNGEDVENELTPLMAYQTGKGGSTTKISLSPGSNTFMSVTGMSFGAPLDNEGKPVGEATLRTMLDKGFGTIGQIANGVYFGDTRVDKSQYDKIIVDGNSLYRAYLPYKTDQYGNITPNFDLFDKFSILDKQLKEDPSKVEELLNTPEFEVFKDYISIDDNGNMLWNNSKMAAFLLVNAESGGESGWFGNYSGIIDPNNTSNFYTSLESLGLDSEEESKRLKDKFKVDVGTDLFRGLVFIPLTNQTSLAMLASGENPTHTGSHSVEHNTYMERATNSQMNFVNNSKKLYN